MAEKKKSADLFYIGAALSWLEEQLTVDEDSEEALDRERLEEFFEKCLAAQDGKLESYAWLIRRIESEEKEAREIANEFQGKAQARRRKVAWLKSRILEFLEQQGQAKLKAGRVTFSRQKNGGKLPLEVDPTAELPDAFYRTERTLMTDEVRAALDEGREFDGVTLGEPGHHLRIR